MRIKTTINIRQSQLDKLSSVALQYNVTLSFIINSLACKIMKHSNYTMRLSSAIQYQARLVDNSDFWQCQHVSLHDDIYEQCFDFKKLFKFSFSFIISIAIDKYLNQLINELKNNEKSDNYSTNYMLIYLSEGSNRKIIISWKEEEPEKQQKIQEINIE